MATSAPTGRRGPLRVVAAIVHPSGRLLLVERRGAPQLQAPAGVVHVDETPTDAIHRVVRELTGLTVAERGITAVHTEHDCIVVTMRCEIRGIGSDFTDGTTGLHWCDASELRAPIDEPLAGALRAALDVRQATAGRIHQLAS